MIDLLNERIRRTGEEPSSPDRNPLARLYHSTSGSNRKTSTRSSQGDSHFTLYTKDDKKRTKRDSKDSSGSTKDKKDPSLLRKRTPTTPEFPHRASPDSNALKSGQTILTQIGTPDHNGWMRKKGDHYGSWKNRYFVLKGPHLYWLKSNAQTVGYRVASHLSVMRDSSAFCRRRRSRDMLISLVTVLSPMRTSIPGDMDSDWYTTRIGTTSSARMNR